MCVFFGILGVGLDLLRWLRNGMMAARGRIDIENKSFCL